MNHFRALLAAAALGLAAAPLLRAEDWTTTDGKVYKDVKVLQLEDDAVTILDSDGGALVPLATLPPDLQEKFKYDPAKAKVAAAARAQADANNPAALEAERVQAAKLKAAQDAKYAADKKAVDEAKAAAAATSVKPDPLHATQFTLTAPADPTHHPVSDAFEKHDPDMPVIAPNPTAGMAPSDTPAIKAPATNAAPVPAAPTGQ